MNQNSEQLAFPHYNLMHGGDAGRRGALQETVGLLTAVEHPRTQDSQMCSFGIPTPVLVTRSQQLLPIEKQVAYGVGL